MKENVTSKVNQCKHCFSYYIEGVEGEKNFCDFCLDFSSEVTEELDKKDIPEADIE